MTDVFINSASKLSVYITPSDIGKYMKDIYSGYKYLVVYESYYYKAQSVIRVPLF